LGKWWWKMASNENWCGWPIICFNYGISFWNLNIRRQGRVSLFWSGIFSCLPAFIGCSDQNSSAGPLTPDSVHGSFSWTLTPNRIFSVKSFYTFLADGGVRCPVYKSIWNSLCPLKINIFNWLAWRNKILTLENLALRRCNKLPTTTCVLCHSDCESANHLFLTCPFVIQIWGFFLRLLNLPQLPPTLDEVWRSWSCKLRSHQRDVGCLCVKAVMWHVWLTRNDCIFNSVTVSPVYVVSKIAHVLIFWFSSAPASLQTRFDAPTESIRRSLAFPGQRETPSSSTAHGGDEVPLEEE